jgi:hypothetical protein
MVWLKCINTIVVSDFYGDNCARKLERFYHGIDTDFVQTMVHGDDSAKPYLLFTQLDYIAKAQALKVAMTNRSSSESFEEEYTLRFIIPTSY